MAFNSLRDLQLFVRIYEQGSITAAADLLDLTPAVASKRLKHLETEAGEALFHRSTRTLSPTGAGLVLYDYARALLATAAEAQARISGGHEPSGFLRITASVAFGRLYLAPLLTEFLQRYREIQVDAVFTDKTLDMNDDGIDLAVRICMPQSHPSLIMRRLCSGRRKLCASPAYIEAHGQPQSPRDLKRHNCIVLDQYDVWKLQRGQRTESVRVRGSLHSNDGEVVLDAIKQGLGIGVVALWHGGPDLAAGRLLGVLEDYALSPQPDVFAVYHSNQKQLPRLQALLSYINEHLDVHGQSDTIAYA